jgi:hypothetical protein
MIPPTKRQNNNKTTKPQEYSKNEPSIFGKEYKKNDKAKNSEKMCRNKLKYHISNSKILPSKERTEDKNAHTTR